MNIVRKQFQNKKKETKMSKEKIAELKKQAQEVIRKAQGQQRKLLNDAKQIEAQTKLQIAEKAILFSQNKISEDELKQFILDNYL